MVQRFAGRDGSECAWNRCTSDAGVIRRCYFFLPEAKLGCHPAVFWLGAAAIVLIFSFLGFLVSRLPFCSPLAILLSLLFDIDRTPIVVLTARSAHDAGAACSSAVIARSSASITV